uniref:uncharacterized protein LOC118143786 n=1 Tax=Callithrix jacchus TaxID=9483 RepID=UPI0023DCF2E0|nr:uncharacterized protein LOC118143786 [Callithrix jacchus]XP_054093692.1 uncharacterized protein LOC118143786 [Callithrix jacchus]XP_054093693.1 uncharacterized protein LOC118143786 [Callithrix jacchus]
MTEAALSHWVVCSSSHLPRWVPLLSPLCSTGVGVCLCQASGLDALGPSSSTPGEDLRLELVSIPNLPRSGPGLGGELTCNNDCPREWGPHWPSSPKTISRHPCWGHLGWERAPLHLLTLQDRAWILPCVASGKFVSWAKGCGHDLSNGIPSGRNALPKAFIARVEGSLRGTFCFVFLYLSRAAAPRCPGLGPNPPCRTPCCACLGVWGGRRGSSLEGCVSGFSRLPALPQHSICLFNPGHYPGLCPASGGWKCDPAPLIADGARLQQPQLGGEEDRTLHRQTGGGWEWIPHQVSGLGAPWDQDSPVLLASHSRPVHPQRGFQCPASAQRPNLPTRPLLSEQRYPPQHPSPGCQSSVGAAEVLDLALGMAWICLHLKPSSHLMPPQRAGRVERVVALLSQGPCPKSATPPARAYLENEPASGGIVLPRRLGSKESLPGCRGGMQVRGGGQAAFTLAKDLRCLQGASAPLGKGPGLIRGCGNAEVCCP